MAFNYTLLICVFRISNAVLAIHSPSALMVDAFKQQKIIMNSFSEMSKNYNEISLL